ncbi:MAG: hypothetical protein KDA99_30880 [Planctomycetales bacterium]|nr:hypothetical protein [Planctomycetales bacterium]
MKCTFVDIGGTKKRCVHSGCGQVIDSPDPPEKCHADCLSPAARSEREKARLARIAKLDLLIVARTMVADIVASNARTRKQRPVRSELRVLELLSQHCAKKVPGPCPYFLGDQCGHIKARCSIVACANMACGLGDFEEDA